MQPSQLQAGEAQRCNVVEDCTGEIPLAGNTIHLAVNPFEILTLRLRTRTEPRKRR